MYNSEQKLRFIGNRAKSMEFYYTSLFNAFEPYELKYETDVALLPKEIVEDVFSNEFGTKVDSVRRMVYILQAYHEWCIENGLDVSDNCFDIKLEFGDKIRKSMVASPMHLELKLDGIYDPVEDNTMDCVYRAFLWLIFAGMTEYEAVDVLTKNVDWENMLVHHNNKAYDIYKEAVPALRKACNLNEVFYKHPKYSEMIVRKRAENEFLFRGVRAERIGISAFRGILQLATKESSTKLNHRAIFWSGNFYRQYELERVGATPDFTGLAVDNVMRKQNEHPEKNINFEVAVAQTRSSYKRDYLQWKKAFAK